MRILLHGPYMMDGSDSQLMHHGAQNDGSRRLIVSTANGRLRREEKLALIMGAPLRG